MSLANQKFGKSGLELPSLFFGATSLGNLFREVPDADKSEIVEAWSNCGLRPFVIDSAGKYGAGLSLEVIGRELNRLDIPEDQAIVSNKLGWRREPLKGKEPTFEPGAWFGLKHDAVQDISYDGILRCWEEGNALLGGRAAQLVSVHDPDEYLDAATDAQDRDRRFEDLVQAYSALRELKHAGKVAAVGVGAKNWTAIEELSHHCEFDWVMFANSFTVMRHPKPLSDFMHNLASKGAAIINSALFQGGFLLGGDFFDYRRVDPSDPQDHERLQWRDSLVRVCKEFQCSPFEVGVAFGKAHPAVTAIALSSSRAERVQDHVHAMSVELAGDVWQRMREFGMLEDYVDFV
ncbi:MAG: aldo/keto reductase [Planctomycetota bacterium]